MNWSKGGPGVKRGFGFGGFSLASGKKEESKLPQQSHAAFGSSSGKNNQPQLPSFYKIGSKRANFDDENAYFEDDDDDSSNVDLPYIPAENSPTRKQFHSKGTEESDSEEDPLDAFMAEVEDQAARDMKRLEEKDKDRKNTKGIRDDIEEEDDQEAYFRYMAENPMAGVIQEEEEDNVEYDSDGNPIAVIKKIIDPLPPIDHSEIEYSPFEKNFYIEHDEIANLTAQQVHELRAKLNLRVSGADPPKPCSSFAHFGFDEQLMHQIRKSEYTQPTPIQCQGVPVMLSGRDLIGIAKTGSGKTAAFIWPMLVHIMDQKELQPGDGPIAIVVCPTRELCQQNMHSMFSDDFSSHFLFLVALLFSATFRRKIEKLARDILTDPIRVVQGDIGEANEDVTQIVEILHSEADKWAWLTNRLVEFTSTGSVLIFVTKKANSEELASALLHVDQNIGLLHGDMDQNERNKVITEFKKKTLPVLVATDVAARGLDIPSIKTVVNYDVARDIDTHTHRIGRTGRAGEKGVAYTLLTARDVNFAGDLVRNLEGANQYVSKDLMDLAMQNAWFRKSRFKAGKGKRLNIGGGGLGYRERPGLGSESTDFQNNSVMSNYEAYKPSTGAMGDRLSAMKNAFQLQYKNHFVAASSSAQKTSNLDSSAGGWTSAGSLSSVPSKTPQNASSDLLDAASLKQLQGYPMSGSFSSIITGYSSSGGINFGGNSAGGNALENTSSSSSSSRDRYSDSKSSSRHGDGHRHGDGSRRSDGHRHGDSGSRHGDGGSRHGDGGSRHGERDRYGEGRHSSSSRHSESRSSSERNGESKRESSSSRDSKSESFAIPEPPKRKKSRWDS
ncbi:ATP-dependent RNA helicase DDX42 [Protopterus annectens]|uniref:ATP-dependent RNA helicase DDX42 n=1 Tax=Protopterus annectens TaxID=7888 RepID=UPI001CFC294D|nr:ATP-dependent RNA helicase DDX42 [Protopterus annectens]